MTNDKDTLPTHTSSENEIDAFLKRVAVTPTNKTPGEPGRLIFALDATASRQPTWDSAAEIQGQMFGATSGLGGLEIQLCLYRGFGEFKVSPWLSDSKALLRLMTSVTCLAGETQIGKVLSHATNMANKRKINALVFVGDCIEEDVDVLGHRAGELGILGVPAFMFHEGNNDIAAFAFKQIARLTNGAYCRFDASSAKALRDLLNAVAVYAAGGHGALDKLAEEKGGETLKIAHQVKGGR